ncbi:MAG: LysR family transcriptional regulator [Pseudomonadota bacterium]
MKHRLPPLESLKAFEAAARHLSFSLAADELCITKGAVSYQIRKLEEHLQCTLFKRSVRQVLLTDSGQLLLQSTRQAFSTLSDTLVRLEGENQHCNVTVAATTYVATRWLSRHISAFNELNPSASVLLQHSVNSADFKLGEVDLASRWGQRRQRTDPHRFGEIPMPLYPAISPRRLARSGLPVEAPLDVHKLCESSLAEVPLLVEGRQQDLWQEWLDAGLGRENTAERLRNPRRVVSDANVKVQAAIDGQGFILADDLMLREFNHDLLVAPFRHALSGYGYALLHAPNRFLNANAAALKDWLREQAASKPC